MPGQIGKRITQMDTHYVNSPAICLPGCKEMPGAPQPGDIAPDAKLVSGKSLYSALQPMRHLVLLFEGQAHSAAHTLQRQLQDRFGEAISVLRIAHEPGEADVIVDSEGQLHALYGVTMRGDGVTTVISQRIREEQRIREDQPA